MRKTKRNSGNPTQNSKHIVNQIIKILLSNTVKLLERKNSMFAIRFLVQTNKMFF